MAPDERRRAIVDAVVPLLLEHGDDVTTRQIAEAAGIAEGTIFRVFPDKPALLMAAAEETMNPPDGGAELDAALAGHADLRERVRSPPSGCIERSERVMAVMMALRRIWMSQPPEASRAAPPGRRLHAGRQPRAARPCSPSVFEPHRDELAVDPRPPPPLLRTLVLGSRHPGADAETRAHPRADHRRAARRDPSPSGRED